LHEITLARLDRKSCTTPLGRTHPVTLEDITTPGDDKKSVWAQIFGRDEKVVRLFRTMLDEEEATYRRLMELAHAVRPRFVDPTIE
jgi:hypothetical protein